MIFSVRDSGPASVSPALFILTVAFSFICHLKMGKCSPLVLFKHKIKR